MAYEYLPNPVRAVRRALRYALKSNLRLFGAYHPRYCTVCGYTGRFYSYGFPLAADSLCPNCLSLERHRALAIVDAEEGLFRDKEILHFAPEPGIAAFIRKRNPKSYQTGDLLKPDVDHQLDLQNISLPDKSFDVVICSHVLEHVPDDRKAMSELLRILRPGGLAVVMVPIEEGMDETYENPSVISNGDRLIHFGQEDHVRYYGRDLRDRLREAGFALREWVAKEPFVLKNGLRRGERVFLCTRPA